MTTLNEMLEAEYNRIANIPDTAILLDAILGPCSLGEDEQEQPEQKSTK